MNATDIQVNDLIAIGPSNAQNHGCQDYAILQYLGDGEAEVVEADSCQSCWQVGHDRNHVFAEPGEVWELNRFEIVPADGNWHKDIKWMAV